MTYVARAEGHENRFTRGLEWNCLETSIRPAAELVNGAIVAVAGATGRDQDAQKARRAWQRAPAPVISLAGGGRPDIRG